MANTGRNDPCHCGSGKKYKKCCQPKEEAAELKTIGKDQAAREERARARRMEERAAKAEFLERFAEAAAVPDDLDELTTASNAAVDLVHAGKLEEAEVVARDLLARFPEVHDGWDRLGMVHEARGEKSRRQTATARRSRSSASTPATIRPSRRCSSSSSPNSIPQQPPNCSAAHDH